MSRVAIVLLNWNGWRDTISCIESLFALENDDVHIYVCDNASTDDSVAQLREWVDRNLETANRKRETLGLTGFTVRDLFHFTWDPDPMLVGRIKAVNSVTFIQNRRNGGFAFGNNIGLLQAWCNDSEYFWVLNNDTEVEPDSLTWLLKRMDADPEIGICGSTLVYNAKRDTVQTWGGSKFLPLKGYSVALGAFHARAEEVDAHSVEKQLSYVNGASMFISKAFYEKIGPMREDYFLYWEELEWCYRAKGMFKLGYAEKSIVYHKVGASIGTKDEGESSVFSDYYMYRNQIRFCLQYSKISLPNAALRILRSAMKSALAKDYRRSKTHLRALLNLPYS
ncbi:glycosyl transferase family 2 [Rhizobium wenxiniae]|uniref:Glycosyltransferase 2-like domain-containing protein n=1 Tax=Rhizobium wenxiniae TaxID=1737357 RepID=A0A7W9Y403_9HYPH|nr:glycosyltransferase family 2 protein [Rhizobium wenxiniae]MBB6161063.1 hypothetical protein [Rhizobium wenxiniae]GGF86057.1 glycosyl transferase family 2 [Rhizobium wenxiniae]